jgi:hypothetical protein
MSYGITKPNIHEKGIVQRRQENAKEQEFSGKIFDTEETDDEFIEKANQESTTVFYKENPDAIPPGALDEKPDTRTKRENKITDGYILISQSLIKKLINKYQEEEKFCPKYIKECVMERKCKDISSDAMMAGKFFESHVLGGTTGSSRVLDLPRKKLSKKRELELIAKGYPVIGEKRIDQQRLEIQVERFKQKAQQLQVEIITGVNTHLDIFKHWDGKKYLLVGELDLFPTPIIYEGLLRLAIIDVKVTSNVNTTFGNFCWGTPKFMDHLQADMYHYLVRDIDFELNPHLINVVPENVLNMIKNNNILFLYWVWGYQSEPLELQEKIVERTYFDENNNNYRQREMKERIRKAIAIIEREEAFGWEANPIPEQCARCSLNQSNGGNCEASINSKV